MIKNIIFDCGKVIMQYDERYICSFITDNKNDIETLAAVAMARKYWNAFDKGELTDEVYLREVKKELPERLHSAVEKLYSEWISHMPPVPGIENVVRELHENGKKIYLLSNFNKSLRKNLHFAPALSMFDGLVISGEVKMAKPDREIYEYLLDTYKLNPAECIFVDDREDNIEAGEEVGIQGYLFDGDSEKLRAYFKETGIL